MNTTMIVLLCFAVGSASFLLGSFYSSKATEAKIHNVMFKVDSVIRLLQLKLITENDHRGFHTRTQVSEWLKRMGPEVKEEFYSGANHGRKTL